jgi:hypothetical protein
LPGRAWLAMRSEPTEKLALVSAMA